MLVHSVRYYVDTTFNSSYCFLLVVVTLYVSFFIFDLRVINNHTNLFIPVNDIRQISSLAYLCLHFLLLSSLRDHFFLMKYVSSSVDMS